MLINDIVFLNTRNNVIEKKMFRQLNLLMLRRLNIYIRAFRGSPKI